MIVKENYLCFLWSFLLWYEDQLIDILTEGKEIEQFYEESTNFEMLYQETLTLIDDLVIKCTTRHTQSIKESTVNNEEGVRDKDSSSRAGSSTVGQRPAVKLPKLKVTKFRGDYTNWLSFMYSFKVTMHSSTTQLQLICKHW